MYSKHSRNVDLMVRDNKIIKKIIIPVTDVGLRGHTHTHTHSLT